MKYHRLWREELLREVSYNPPDTSVWINSMMELQRRREERLVSWTRMHVMVIMVLAASTIADVIIALFSNNHCGCRGLKEHYSAQRRWN